MHVISATKSKDYTVTLNTERNRNLMKNFMQTVLKPKNHMLYAKIFRYDHWPSFSRKFDL